MKPSFSFLTFQRVAYGILGLFMGIMIIVTIIAYTRGYSGVTGLDMSKVQKMRYSANEKEIGLKGGKRD